MTESSYIIYSDTIGGTTYYRAKNGQTGAIDYSGTVASTVINAALGNLTAGRTWKEKVTLKGDFTITAVVDIPSYTIFELHGRMIVGATILSGNLIICNAVTQVDIIDGLYDGNRATYVGNIVIGMLASSYVTIQNTTVKSGTNYGILAHSSTHVQILNNEVYDTGLCGIGVIYDSSDVLIEGNVLQDHDVWPVAIGIACPNNPCHEINFSKNFVYHATDTVSAVHISNGAYDIEINDNILIHVGVDGSLVWNNGGWKITVEDNICYTANRYINGIVHNYSTPTGRVDYTIQGNLMINCGINLEEGQARTDYGAIIKDNYIYNSGITVLGNFGFQWYEVEIDGNIILYPATTDYAGISVYGVIYGIIANNIVINSVPSVGALGSIYIGGGGGTFSQFMNVCNNIVVNAYYGIRELVGCAYNSYIGNIVLNAQMDGIWVAGVEAKVNDNRVMFSSLSAAGTYHAIHLSDEADRSQVNNNYCIDDGDSQEDGIHLDDGVIGCDISHNYCYNNMGSGIALTANNTGCTIIGNRCNNNDDDGIELTATATDNSINDNTCQGNGRFGVNLAAASCLRNSVIDNKCSTSGQHGIYVAGSDCKIDENYCYHNGSTGNNTYDGINLAGTADRCTVNDNTCEGDATRQRNGIRLEDGAISAVINGNFCYNHATSGIVLVANNDNCIISSNRCMTNAGYGVNIMAATCDFNIVGENQLLGNTTGSLNDLGVGTDANHNQV